MRIVHQGRGGYIELDGAQYPIEHVGDGRFVVHVSSRAPRAHRAALEQLVAEQPERWAIARRPRQPDRG